MPGTEPNLTPPPVDTPEAVVGSAQPGLEIDPLPLTPKPDSTLAAASAQEAPGVMPATTEAAAEAEEIAERDPVPPPANLVEPAIDPPNAGNVEPSAESTSTATPPPAAEKIEPAAEAPETNAVTPAPEPHVAEQPVQEEPKKKGLREWFANLLPHHEEHAQEALVQTGYRDPNKAQTPGIDPDQVARQREMAERTPVAGSAEQSYIQRGGEVPPVKEQDHDKAA